MVSGTGTPSEGLTLSRGRVAAFGVLLLIDFVLVAVMLATDKNLQTDFGTVSPYFAHWYGLLAEGVLTILAALAVLMAAFRISKGGRGLWSSRGLVLGALVFTIVALVGDLAIVFTYGQLGFPITMMQFAQYLYGSVPASGDIRYLYDVVLAAYGVSAITGAFALRRVRSSAVP